MERFSFTVADSAQNLIALHGELDFYSADDFSAQVEELVRPGALIVLDLHALSFIDSSGLRSLILLQRMADERGARLRLADVRFWILEMFERGSLMEFFDICGNTEEALSGSAALAQ